jgi:chromosomal replication initiation ATPase DnaA
VKEKMSANLLYLYGTSGSGKTRLLQRITESLCETQVTIRVGSERLAEEMAQAVRSHDFNELFDRYVQVTNLLIDNLWVLQSRPAVATEIGRLIHARMAQGNLTILTSDLQYEDVMRNLPAIADCLKQETALHLNLDHLPAPLRTMPHAVVPRFLPPLNHQ